METLRGITSRVEGLSPPFSLRGVGELLGVKGNISLRKLYQDNSKYARIFVAPLTLLQQNMGLLVAPASYAGTERDKAIEALIANLRSDQPDIVGLSECFSDNERKQIKNQLNDIYPYWLEGPDEDDPESDGGLLLLCRYPIVENHQTIYRQCDGEDCLANKGILHARVAVPGYPVEYDVFLTHMQSCPAKIPGLGIGLGYSCTEKLQLYQASHLHSFIQAYSDPYCIAILMGDLNHNALDANAYKGLNIILDNPEDLWKTSGDKSLGITSDNTSSFNKKNPKRSVDDPARHKQGSRLDYFFTWPESSIFIPTFYDTRVVVWQSSAGRDISDHYGLEAHQSCIKELAINQDISISMVSLLMESFHCLKETGGIISQLGGGDEMEFELSYQAASGAKESVKTGIIPTNVHSGMFFYLPIELSVNNPGDWLEIKVTGWEVDPVLWTETGRRQLGPAKLRLDRKQLQFGYGRSAKRVLPLLLGGGGEYAVTVHITVPLDWR